ncbi:MAG: Rho termination factor N-terminal domain-containing protein [Halioglobus sp.]
MANSWTDKDRRMYEHISRDQQRRGKNGGKADAIAARTVNKQRRSEGRTPNDTSQGTGNPNTRLEERTVAKLRNRAAELNIRNRSNMNKQDLIDAIRARN